MHEYLHKYFEIIKKTWKTFFSYVRWDRLQRRVASICVHDRWQYSTPLHRRRSSVNFRTARHFCPNNMYEKLTNCPNFTWFLPEKLSKYPNFMIFVRKINKIPQFYMIFARKCTNFKKNCPKKIFFPNFRRARAPLHGLTRLLRLCSTPHQ